MTTITNMNDEKVYISLPEMALHHYAIVNLSPGEQFYFWAFVSAHYRDPANNVCKLIGNLICSGYDISFGDYEPKPPHVTIYEEEDFVLVYEATIQDGKVVHVGYGVDEYFYMRYHHLLDQADMENKDD